ncbi:MAG: RNA polymerase sigma-70 factor (ECF subfamily) [Planctomycetota bacterium]|jgi:RNA polymerase sigma-70 factor (ECF subfamily)
MLGLGRPRTIAEIVYGEGLVKPIGIAHQHPAGQIFRPSAQRWVWRWSESCTMEYTSQSDNGGPQGVRWASDALLKHENFVRAVVGRLLQDEASVQDAVQETYLRVSKAPPLASNDEKSVAAWLGRVASNVAKSLRRGDRRRRVREQLVARDEVDEGADGADGAAERMESRQRVVGHVLQLKEPYRTVILMRYEQGLSPSEIAVQLGRGASTVRAQLTRAHEILRRDLDREFGDRRDWAVLALPLGAGTAIPRAGIPDSSSTTSAPVSQAAGSAGSKAMELAPSLFRGHGGGLGLLAAGAGCLGLVVWLASSFGAEGGSSGGLSPVGAIEPAGQPDPAKFNTPQHSRVASVPVEALEETPPKPRVSTPTIRLGRAELFDQASFDDYEQATFSFEHGLRDDSFSRASNDWDLQLDGGKFRVNMVTDDRSRIYELGPGSLDGLTPKSLGEGAFGVEAAVRGGDCYLVWTRDNNTDQLAAFEVVELEPGKRALLEWYTLNRGGQGYGSLAEPGEGLRSLLEVARRFSTVGTELEGPRVLLQVRNGASGGMACEINMTGAMNVQLELADEALVDLQGVVRNGDESSHYMQAGLIPPDRMFLVRQVRLQGYSGGETGGCFTVLVGGEKLIDEQLPAGPVERSWGDERILVSGDELRTSLEVPNPGAGELVIEGELIEANPPTGELLPSGVLLFPRPWLAEASGLWLDSGEVSVLSEITPLLPDLRLSHFGLRGSGSMRLYALGEVPLAEADPKLLACGPIGRHERIDPVLGASYLLAAPGAETLYVSVVGQEPGAGFELDWFLLDGIGHARGTLVDKPDRSLSRRLTKLREGVLAQYQIKGARTCLQLAIPNLGRREARVEMAGRTSDTPVLVEEEVLGMDLGDTRKTLGRGYRRGGWIPKGKVLVVTSAQVTLRVGELGANPKGSIRVQLGAHTLLSVSAPTKDLSKSWTGRLELRAGDEDEVYVQGTAGTAVSLELSGKLMDASELK